MAAIMPDINFLKQLLELFDASTVNELRIEQEGVAIRLSKTVKNEGGGAIPQIAYAPLTQMAQQPASVQEAPAATPAESAPEKIYHEIHSPIVGTFYRASSPDSPSFADVGDSVSPGMVLCIVEAMKLMNEIECDCYGRIAKILVENGKPVEYNQPLFLIEPE